MSKTPGMNKHQKAAHRVGERRVGKEQVAELLEMSQSDDPQDRELAAQYLCPCHVRTRIPAVWEALYRMLEDPEPRVRRAAWHTLEDGGRPDDPALDEIVERAQITETEPQVLAMMRRVIGPRKDRELVRLKLAGRPQPRERGKCDFCGASDAFVQRDLETLIPNGDFPRPALICDNCAKNTANGG